MEKKIVIAKIVNTIGLKGELRVIADKSNAERLYNVQEVFIEGFNEKFKISKVRPAGKNLAIKLQGYDVIEQVEKFKGRDILLDAENDFVLLQDEYYIEDLLNCSILVDGKLAKIVAVDNYGATDIFTFELDGKEMQIPFVLDFFEKIDVENKILVASKQFFEGVV